MPLIDDDIREYDPLLWVKIKQKNKVINDNAEKREKKIKEKKIK